MPITADNALMFELLIFSPPSNLAAYVCPDGSAIPSGYHKLTSTKFIMVTSSVDSFAAHERSCHEVRGRALWITPEEAEDLLDPGAGTAGLTLLSFLYDIAPKRWFVYFSI